MSIERNKATVRRFVEEVLLGGRLDLVDELFTADYVVHDPSNPARPGGREGARAFVSLFHTGLRDRAYEVEDLTAEGDRVFYRWTLRGLHAGDFMGIPATGRSLRIQGMDAFRLQDGRIAESWVAADALGLLIQLGVLPPPGPPPASA